MRKRQCVKLIFNFCLRFVQLTLSLAVVCLSYYSAIICCVSNVIEFYMARKLHSAYLTSQSSLYITAVSYVLGIMLAKSSMLFCANFRVFSLEYEYLFLQKCLLLQRFAMFFYDPCHSPLLFIATKSKNRCEYNMTHSS